MTDDLNDHRVWLIEDVLSCLGDADGPFSTDRAKTLEADQFLEELGLGPSQLGFGLGAKDGNAEKLEALADLAMSGDPRAFDAAMRYVGVRLFAPTQFPAKLAYLVAGYLAGRIRRPPSRKATSAGLSIRDLAIFVCVQLVSFTGLTLEESYYFVANELRKRKLKPTNAKSVKGIHLKTRKMRHEDMTLHHVAFLCSLRAFTSEILDLRADLALDRWSAIRGHD